MTDDAMLAVDRRFNGLLVEAYEHYRQQIITIERRRRLAIQRVKQSAAYAEMVYEAYGDRGQYDNEVSGVA
jgi:hypothetical protein